MSMRHRVVVVGTGNISALWLSYVAAREDVEVVALVDRQPERAEVAAKRFGIDAPRFVDVESALAAVDATLLFDLTVPEAHPDVTGVAFQHGLNVFSEKPLAASMHEAAELVTKAAEGGLHYSIMQNRRYLAGIRTLKAIIDSGHIGELAMLTGDCFIALHHGDYRETMDYPLLLDMSVHTWDQSRYLTGRTPTWVEARSFRPKGSWFRGDTAALVTFEYDDGLIFHYRGHYNAEGASTSFESSWRAVGTSGTGIWDGHGPAYAETARPDQDQAKVREHDRWTPPSAYEGRLQHDGALDEMFAALEEGRDSATAGHDNISSVAMLHAILRSIETGARVAV